MRSARMRATSVSAGSRSPSNMSRRCQRITGISMRSVRYDATVNDTNR